jgi:hypothetical protein
MSLTDRAKQSLYKGDVWLVPCDAPYLLPLRSTDPLTRTTGRSLPTVPRSPPFKSVVCQWGSGPVRSYGKARPSPPRPPPYASSNSWAPSRGNHKSISITFLPGRVRINCTYTVMPHSCIGTPELELLCGVRKSSGYTSLAVMICERRISSGKRNPPFKEGASSFSLMCTCSLAVRGPSKFWKRSALAISCCS